MKRKAGKYYTPEDILEILGKEKIFILESKGGVTFSGGEPMLQTEFLLDALRKMQSWRLSYGSRYFRILNGREL